MRNVTVALIIGLGFLQANTLNAQKAKDQINYFAEGIYMITTDKDGVEHLRKPLGRGVYITYDQFFKSYTILYRDENGETNGINLEYIKDETADKDLKTLKMQDKFHNIYYVVDLLKQMGKLKILVPKPRENETPWIIVEKAEQVLN